MTVWITQLLCPARHCIIAWADEAETDQQAVEGVEMRLRAFTRTSLRSGAINPHCAICGADKATWRYETRRTRFATMAEAEPVLRGEEVKQSITNAIFGDTLSKSTKH